MDDDRVAKWCRIIGKTLIVGAVILLVCSWVFNAEDDSRSMMCDLLFLGGHGRRMRFPVAGEFHWPSAANYLKHLLEREVDLFGGPVKEYMSCRLFILEH